MINALLWLSFLCLSLLIEEKLGGSSSSWEVLFIKSCMQGGESNSDLFTIDENNQHLNEYNSDSFTIADK